MVAKKKNPEPKVEYKVRNGQVEEVLLWHGPECLFHLKRMAPDFIWFSTYVNSASNHVEIKIEPGESPQITMKDAESLNGKPKKEKKLPLRQQGQSDKISEVKSPEEQPNDEHSTQPAATGD